MVGVGFAAVKALGVAGQLASGIMSAKARQAEFADQLRAVQLKKDYTISLARARASASGIEMDSSSTVNYLAGLTGEFDRELANLRRAKSQAEGAALLGNISTALGGAADVTGGLGQLNNFWR